MPVIDFRRAARQLGAAHVAVRVGDLVPLWLQDRRADGRRPRGTESYEYKIGQFLTYAGQDLTLDGYSEELIKAYKRHLAERVEAGTVSLALTVLRSFGAWCVAEGYLEKNPALGVPHPKVEDPDPDPLSRDQIAQLLRALDVRLPSQRDYKVPRTQRAVALMLYAGLRIAEVAGLKVKDVDLDRRTIIVRRENAKGGRPRVVPICEELAVVLEPVRGRHPEWAVVDQGDLKKSRGKHLTVKSLAHVFERWLPARLGWPIHAHALRTTFATELYMRGEELLTIQRLLGHADPKTTLRYIGACAEREREAVRLLTFRADLLGNLAPVTDNGSPPS